MERLIFYICTFALISSAVGNSKKIGSANDNYNTCLTENNASDDDMFTLSDIIHDRHKQSENQEKIKKNGCIIQCLLQKVGAMDGSEYNTEQIHSDFTKRTNAQPGEKIYESLDNCLNKTKDLTEKCEKSFALMECFVKAEDRIFPHSSESHEEHEHEHESE